MLPTRTLYWIPIRGQPRSRVFRGMNGNGQWTLFLADLAPGSVHELRGWERSIRSGSMPAPPDLAVTRVKEGIEVRFRGREQV